MIDELKRNVNTEIEILREISAYLNRRTLVSENEVKLIDGAILSLQNTMKVINGSIPTLLEQISATPRLPVSTLSSRPAENKREGPGGKLEPVTITVESTKTPLEKVTYQRFDSRFQVVLPSKDREKFLRELKISENLVKRFKKSESESVEKYEEFKAARGYLKYSNRFFFDTSRKLVKKGYFKQLSVELRRANIDILFESFVAMVFFSTFIALILGVFVYIFFIFFTFNASTIPLKLFTGNYLLRAGQLLWIPFAIGAATFGFLYYYPSNERSSLAKKIDQELPFAVIHMSAISGSGIEPSQIFKIIGMSKEYPFLRREFRKVLNQINIYGYDLVTALNNTSKSTPSEKLAEVFAGLSTTITSGASLTEYFSKRAETLLANYALEREKYTKLAETFMDIYISVVIAAPMIFLLLLIIMSIAGVSVGFGPSQLGLIIVGAVSLLNLFFIGFLHMKQPAY